MADRINSIVCAVDRWQRRHAAAAFLYAVIKKYSDDEAGYKAALLTYYGFLSLFPLLLVLASVVSLLAARGVPVGDKILTDATNYIPFVGHDVVSHVHRLGGNGLALAAGIVLTFFGARGVADAFRFTLDHVWGVPYVRRAGFPLNIGKSLMVMALGGAGLVLSAAATGAVLAGGHEIIFRGLSVSVAFLGIFGTAYVIMRIDLSVPQSRRCVMQSALYVAVGTELLQMFGGYILAHQLHRLNSLYGAFAVVLGLLFWLYLQAQIMLYSLEITMVAAKRLWPRSMQAPRTPADQKSEQLYVTRDTRTA
ncbi:MAG TPA: YihY/virulence factor BrkB family protein [Candidatus Saccharimonadales bacterium]|nr:YihY/virulence factor BrkB family protein [Candidatus Saccharimonadales bacterium]